MTKYTYVDATPTRTRINTLLGTGWSRRAIANATNGVITDQGINNITAGRHDRVRDVTAAAVLAIDPFTLPVASYKGAEPWVPKYRSIRRIHALLAIGWTHRHISQACGFQTGSFINQTTAGLCLLSTHQKVATAYRDLATRPGPSEITRQRARRLGYPSPIAWDDIDMDQAPDLDAPVEWVNDDEIDPVVIQRILSGDPLPATTAERCAVVAAWPSTGRPLSDLARFTGWKPERYASTRHEDAA